MDALQQAAGWAGYDKALVLDMLATPTPFNVPDIYDMPLTAEMVANALCGIVAGALVLGVVHAAQRLWRPRPA